MQEKCILGIETSCDDTSIAIYYHHPKNREHSKLLGHTAFSQEQILSAWGGVVPEIAARNHLDKLIPLLDLCLKKSGVTLQEIDAIAVTTSPGLLGPLLTGINLAKSLSLLLKLPIIPINHLHAHLEAIGLSDRNIIYPYLGMLVSGGHTAYYFVEGPDQFKHLGGSIDDAAGEALDKGGKMLGLGYPAGKIIDELSKKGNANAYPFPVSKISSDIPQLSFSGIKSHLRQFLDKNKYDEKSKTFLIGNWDYHDIIASYQEGVVKTLLYGLDVAISSCEKKDLQLVVGGGVASNSRLRQYLIKNIPANLKSVHFVEPQFCTDNGAMVAHLASKLAHKEVSFPKSLLLDAIQSQKIGIKK